MNNKERLVIIFVLAVVAFMVGVDLLTDSREGVLAWHVVVEGSAGLAALFGIFYFVKGNFQLQHRLSDSQDENKRLQLQAQQWKSETRKYIDGLSKAIDTQLSDWSLSNAEKEVALLLLKGLSLKEIAEIRQTTEKTARVQSIAVYAKSGLAGRSELAAFFLEDLLQPQSLSVNQDAPTSDRS